MRPWDLAELRAVLPGVPAPDAPPDLRGIEEIVAEFRFHDSRYFRKWCKPRGITCPRGKNGRVDRNRVMVAIATDRLDRLVRLAEKELKRQPPPVRGRETPPTDAEIDAHAGGWLARGIVNGRANDWVMTPDQTREIVHRARSGELRVLFWCPLDGVTKRVCVAEVAA